MTDDAKYLVANGPEHSSSIIEPPNDANTTNDHKAPATTAEMTDPPSVTINGIEHSNSQTGSKDGVATIGAMKVNEAVSSTEKKVQFNVDYDPSLPTIAELMGSDDEAKGKEGDLEHDLDPLDPKTMTSGVGQKKKRKKKPKSQRGLNAPTGFEEFYVDAPVTPVEFEEERKIYDPSRPFTERIQTAIQRYQAKRNMNSDRKNLFDKYLVYGGIAAGQKMFGGGLDPQTLENSNATEIARLTATSFVGEDKEGAGELGSKYVVDFDGVIKGFLSSRLSAIFNMTTEEKVKQYTNIIQNFLNYLLHHDVCPEYKDQIYTARKTVHGAERELWNVQQLQQMLPGDFNMACSTLFGGHYANLYTGDKDWDSDISPTGMSQERARQIFKLGLAAYGDDAMFNLYNEQVIDKEVEIEEVIQTGLEVTSVNTADDQVREYYGKFPNFKTLGFIKAKTWEVPGLGNEDLTEEEEVRAKEKKQTYCYEFWVEDDLVNRMFVGLKFWTTVRKISFGVTYFDTINSVHCSFYRVLPNELVLGWREHKYLPPREKAIPKLTMYDAEGVEVANPRGKYAYMEDNDDDYEDGGDD